MNSAHYRMRSMRTYQPRNAAISSLISICNDTSFGQRAKVMHTEADILRGETGDSHPCACTVSGTPRRTRREARGLPAAGS